MTLLTTGMSIESVSKDGRKVIVRKTLPEDVPQLISNFEKIAAERRYLGTEQVSEEQKERIKKRIHDENALSAVVLVDSRVAGYITLVQYGNLEKTKNVYSLSMGIVDGYREIGAGSSMMDFALKWARGKNARKVCLEVFSTNTRAIKLYQKFGFEIEGVRKKQFVIEGSFVDEVMMGLLLV